MEQHIVHNEAELDVVAGRLLALAHDFPSTETVVLTLEGELGAGKTTLVQLLGVRLGITERIVSPTFVVMKRYETTDARFDTLFHMDAYRLADEAETAPLRIEDVMATPNSLLCVEWASLVPGVWPIKRIAVTLVEEKGVRTVTITTHGDEDQN
jgi:tRNA threonylcarbamoyladenosine biosynthesis protein TsaE